mgnify:FL=1
MIHKLNILVFAIAAAFLSIGAQADDHAASSEGITGIFSFSTNNPAGVVASLSEFAETDCRKKAPVNIRLMADNWNGTESNTHSVLMTFASAEDMLSTFASFQQCEPWQKLMASSSANSTPHSEYLVRPLVAGGDTTKDAMYMIWQMRVENEPAYVEAWTQLMESQVETGDVTGAYGLWRVVGGAESDYTHLAYAGAPNPLDILSSSLQPTEAVQKFYMEVGEIRTVTRQVMNTVVGDF